jgi:D-glycero-D-manno-heptose 1,7-bisphosphate phosphatase
LRNRYKPIAFLDRDGTINVNPPSGAYVTAPEDLHLIMGARLALQALSEHYSLIVVTNQRGISLGCMSEDDYASVHHRLLELLGEDVDILCEYHCPHEVGVCECRKPANGMLIRALNEHAWANASDAVIIGDSHSDIAAGVITGVHTIRISTISDSLAEFTAPDLEGAVDCAIQLRLACG